MALQSKADALRAELNLKNLRRHDTSIQQILSTASYVTVYRNHGEGWVKTGIEGPMFLFERSHTPRHGFFVLNRQGLEYVQEFLTADSDVKIEGEFLLYEPGEQADRATGLWIAEEKDRTELCRRMVDICNNVKKAAQTPANPLAPLVPTPTSQSISLDDLFGSAANQARMSPVVRNQVPPQPLQQSQASSPTSSRVPALDMLFSSAASPPPPAPASRPQPPPQSPPRTTSQVPQISAPSLLDQMFRSAQQQQPQPQPSPKPAPQSPPPTDARALLAMLGHPNGTPVASSSRSSPAFAQQTTSQQAGSQTLSQALSVSSPVPAPAPAPAPIRQESNRATPNPAQREFSLAKPPSPPQPSTSPAVSSKPMPKFAPPLLSHDVFDMLPPPAGAKRAGSPSTTIKSSVAQPASAAQPTPTASEPRTNGTSPAPSSQANGAPSNQIDKPINKSTLLAALDELVTTQKVGMVDQGVVLGQKEFVNKVQEIIKKPAFATALYAKYLERCDDEDED
ncbi:hypothetical protein ACM66B_004361 [Microbotryomycetes sp. NB124-2]